MRNDFMVVGDIRQVHRFAEGPGLVVPLNFPPNRQQLLVRRQCIAITPTSVLRVELVLGPSRFRHPFVSRRNPRHI